MGFKSYIKAAALIEDWNRHTDESTTRSHPIMHFSFPMKALQDQHSTADSFVQKLTFPYILLQ